jgi:hypothetical protein
MLVDASEKSQKAVTEEKRFLRADTQSVKCQISSNQEGFDFNYYRRRTLADDLASIFEEITIAKVNGRSILGPFSLFSSDSEGGMPSLLSFSIRVISWRCRDRM